MEEREKRLDVKCVAKEILGKRQLRFGFFRAGEKGRRESGSYVVENQ